MIFLLAGHGGGDPGATGVDGRQEYREAIILRDAIMRNLPSGHPVFILTCQTMYICTHLMMLRRLLKMVLLMW